MKKGNQVLNVKAVRAGRMMARWAATGMNWAEGPYRSAVMAEGRRIVGGGVVAADRLGRKFLAAEAAAIAAGHDGTLHTGNPAGCWWQSGASRIILAVAA